MGPGGEDTLESPYSLSVLNLFVSQRLWSELHALLDSFNVLEMKLDIHVQNLVRMCVTYFYAFRFAISGVMCPWTYSDIGGYMRVGGRGSSILVIFSGSSY